MEITLLYGCYIFRAFDFSDREEADSFLLKLCSAIRLFSLRERVGLRFDDKPVPIEPPNYVFPPGWYDGVDAGWEPDQDGSFKIDGEINLFRTHLIPEHARIIDSGILVFQGKRILNFEKLNHYLDDVGEVEAQSAFQDEPLELAFETYAAAYSHAEPALTYISLVTCLEILSRRQKTDSFSSEVVGMIDKVIKERYDEKYLEELFPNQECRELQNRRLEQIKSRVGELKRESTQLAIARLVFEAQEDLKGGGHTLSGTEFIGIDDCIKVVRGIYKVRSTVVHGRKEAIKSGQETAFWGNFDKLKNIVENVLYARLSKTYLV